MKIAMLGSGFIARFYATSLHAQRRKDFIYTVYSRNIDNAKRFAEDFKLAHFTNDMDEAVNNPAVDVVFNFTAKSSARSGSSSMRQSQKACTVH